MMFSDVLLLCRVIWDQTFHISRSIIITSEGKSARPMFIWIPKEQISIFICRSLVSSRGHISPLNMGLHLLSDRVSIY
jgi:hypothetical protein